MINKFEEMLEKKKKKLDNRLDPKLKGQIGKSLDSKIMSTFLEMVKRSMA